MAFGVWRSEFATLEEQELIPTGAVFALLG
jgi:hypothetical protein